MGSISRKTKATLFVVGLIALGLLPVLHVVVNTNNVHQTTIPTPSLSQKEEASHNNTPISIHFSTDFEPKETTATYSSTTKDLTLNFLQPDFIPSILVSKYVSMPIHYEGGTQADRYAEVSSDPTEKTTNNHVLHYWLKNAAIPAEYLSHYKGRLENCFPFAT